MNSELIITTVGLCKLPRIGYLNHPPGAEQTFFRDGSLSSNTNSGNGLSIFTRDLETDLDQLRNAHVTTLVTLCTKQELRYHSLVPETLRKLLEEREIEWIWCPMTNNFIKNPTDPVVSSVALAIQQIENNAKVNPSAFVVFHARPEVMDVTACVIGCYLSLSNIPVEKTLEQLTNLSRVHFSENKIARMTEFVQRFNHAYKSLPPLLDPQKAIPPKAKTRKLAFTFPAPASVLVSREKILSPTIVYGNACTKKGPNEYSWSIFVQRFQGDGQFQNHKELGLGFITHVEFELHMEEPQTFTVFKPPFVVEGSGNSTFMVEIHIHFKRPLNLTPVHLEHELSLETEKAVTQLYTVNLFHRKLKETLLDFKRTKIGWEKTASSPHPAAHVRRPDKHWIVSFFQSSKNSAMDLSSSSPFLQRNSSSPEVNSLAQQFVRKPNPLRTTPTNKSNPKSPRDRKKKTRKTTRNFSGCVISKNSTRCSFRDCWKTSFEYHDEIFGI